MNPAFSAEDYGLDAVARHNAGISNEPLASYAEDPRGLGIYVRQDSLAQDAADSKCKGDYEALYSSEPHYLPDVPTPKSTTASEGIRFRSARPARQTDSPFSPTKSRVSKSPVPRRRDRKSKIDKSKTPKLTAPLSILTKDCGVPVRDIEAYVNRPVEERLREMDKKGYTSRPMNSFMLYRSAYAERTKAWCAQNNHQVVSSLSGESWPMESDDVRAQFDEWAKLERQHHQAAHPNYKFSPSKSSSKRRKGEASDDEDEASDLDRDPDGEYRGGRQSKQRRRGGTEPSYTTGAAGLQSQPYYNHYGSSFDQPYHAYATGRPVPSNVAYEQHSMAYSPHINAYVTSNTPRQQTPHSYGVGLHMGRITTPNPIHGQQSLGGYGLPGGQGQQDDIFSASRTSTPMQHYQSYGQPAYSQFQPQFAQMYQTMPSSSMPQPGSQLFEHQQYLQHASQPATVIDPSLEAAMEAAAVASAGHAMPLVESHFDDALSGVDDYFDRSDSPTGVNATLAPTLKEQM